MQILLALLNSSVHHQSAILHVNDECALYHTNLSQHKEELHFEYFQSAALENTDGGVNQHIQVCVKVYIFLDLHLILKHRGQDNAFYSFHLQETSAESVRQYHFTIPIQR